LVCRTANADTAVLELGRERATVTCLLDDEVVGARTITTTPELGVAEPVELRNFAGLIADELRRKRPEEVYAAGDRDVLRAVRERVRYEFYRVEDDDPVAAVIERRGRPALEVVEGTAAEKLGGSHSTLIGGRAGRRVVRTIADHPHVKKIVPGPIDAGGSGSRSGVRARSS